MKNKKLIATVASLCLVLVAVVAAVIGVLAAAQQNVTSKVKVGYKATNVAATVSINSRTQYGSYQQTEKASESFNAGDKAQTKELEVENQSVAASETLAWQGSGVNDDLNHYAVYRFSFTNNSTNNAMSVSVQYKPTYGTNNESSIEDNVDVKWFQGANAEPTFTINYTDNTTFNTIEATNATLISSVPTDGTKTACISSIAAKSGTAVTNYVFLVVLIHNVDADASFDMTDHGNITFVLDAIANS